MNKNSFQEACQKLIDAALYDRNVYNQLQEAGLLHHGYNPTMRMVHEKNAELLEDFIANYGFPLPSKSAPEIYQAAWFIAIHAISKPILLKQVFALLQKALQDGEPVAQEYARFYDRIALYQGEQQLYGTQFFLSPTGWVARDLFEPEQIDNRRTALGLSTFLENKKELEVTEGGFVDEKKMQEEESYWLTFFKEVGWR